MFIRSKIFHFINTILFVKIYRTLSHLNDVVLTYDAGLLIIVYSLMSLIGQYFIV